MAKRSNLTDKQERPQIQRQPVQNKPKQRPQTAQVQTRPANTRPTLRQTQGQVSKRQNININNRQPKPPLKKEVVKPIPQPSLDLDDDFVFDFGEPEEEIIQTSNKKRQSIGTRVTGLLNKNIKPQQQTKAKEEDTNLKHTKNKQPVIQDGPRTTKKKFMTVILVIAIMGILGGWGLTFIDLGSGPQTTEEKLQARIQENENTPIKSTNSDPVEDAKDALSVFPCSRNELRQMLVSLGHSDGTATETVDKLPENIYNEYDIALRRIDIYLEATGFSSKGLAGRLIADGFDQKISLQAIAEKNKTIDYAEQAKRRGYSYLEYRVVNKNQMIEALKEDGFTEEDITKAVEVLPCDNTN